MKLNKIYNEDPPPVVKPEEGKIRKKN